MTFNWYEVVRTDLTYDMGLYNGETVLKRYADRAKAGAFAEEWEAQWQKNKAEGRSVGGHCWIDCRGELDIREVTITLDD